VRHPDLAREQQSGLPTAPTARALQDHTAHIEPRPVLREQGGGAALEVPPQPLTATERVRNDIAQQGGPPSGSATRTLRAAVEAPQVNEPARAQQLPVSAVAVDDAGAPQPAPRERQSQQLAAMAQRSDSQPRAEMMRAPRSLEPRPAPAAPLQPVVHIGSIEVIVEAPAEPKAAPAAALCGASFSSRYYLRGL
jgi:hypothetical protein